MVRTGVHALKWGLPRMGFALAVALLASLFAITIFVTVLVAIEAASTFGQ